MKVANSTLIYLLVILIVSAYIYENVFLKQYVCARKGLCEVNHLENVTVVVFCKLTAKGAITVIIKIYGYI